MPPPNTYRISKGRYLTAISFNFLGVSLTWASFILMHGKQNDVMNGKSRVKHFYRIYCEMKMLDASLFLAPFIFV